MYRELGSSQSVVIDNISNFAINSSKLDSLVDVTYNKRKRFLATYAADYNIRPELLYIAEKVIKHNYYFDKALLAFSVPAVQPGLEAYVNNADLTDYNYPDFRNACSLAVARIGIKITRQRRRSKAAIQEV
ncbi:hypothetical protein [Pontibacter harenae]|uniref:hypothetical protein n=1 Tax=Pontibacter harenae TaxID=2894083 RepID=UPI001E649F2E|nr:hypothetical protein [Pontibacter harenae]MCC9168118.1 hypothetical protein [Pontibacter harenae]